jgi:hypothetical protein
VSKNKNKNKLVPFAKFSKAEGGERKLLSKTSVIVNGDGVPVGFVFGRDSFISLLSRIDEQFEQRVTDPKKAFDNFAGKTIDLIERNLPVRKSFVLQMKESIAEAEKFGWISLGDLKRSLNV